MRDLKPSRAVLKLLDELGRDRYETYSVYDYFVQAGCRGSRDRVSVILRVDVDSGLHLAEPLARMLQQRSLHASFYFLTHPERYYSVWDSEVPKVVAELGFEVGVHSDHHYEALMRGTDAIESIKADVVRLSGAIGRPVLGLTYHGHEDVNSLGVRNWDPYKALAPASLGLDYHDGYTSGYILEGSQTWAPNTAHRLSDFAADTRNAWRYYPGHTKRMLRKARPGESVHVAFHTVSAFDFAHWESPSGEAPPPEVSRLEHIARWARVRWHLQLGLPAPARVLSYAARRTRRLVTGHPRT